MHIPIQHNTSTFIWHEQHNLDLASPNGWRSIVSSTENFIFVIASPELVKGSTNHCLPACFVPTTLTMRTQDKFGGMCHPIQTPLWKMSAAFCSEFDGFQCMVSGKFIHTLVRSFLVDRMYVNKYTPGRGPQMVGMHIFRGHLK